MVGLARASLLMLTNFTKYDCIPARNSHDSNIIALILEVAACAVYEHSQIYHANFSMQDTVVPMCIVYYAYPQ